MERVKAVEIRAELRQIKTMADHSVSLILNLPEDCTEQVKVLLDWLGDEVGVVMVNKPDSRSGTGGSRTRRKRTISEGE